ncbi:MAG: hypothetical protein LQ343_000093 [Gyalolechia ehrenbergii]|nr:MAG: hypothetical protein LQ343_000093 [Gyalolechia ehrenbergii]
MSIVSSRASSRFFVVFQKYCALTGPSHALRGSTSSIPPHYQRGQRQPIHVIRHASTGTAGIQKESLRPQNHYDLFPSNFPSGPPPSSSFHIEPSKLRKEFLQLQAQAHPDRHQGADKAKAEAASARINDAYKTLLNPLARARYLLSLRGVELGEDESIAGSPSGLSDEGTGGQKVDSEFLMDVMDVREEVEEASSREEVEEMKAKNNERKKASEDRLDELFKAGDIDSARRETVKLGYWVNVGTALEGWEKVGDGRVSEHD